MCSEALLKQVRSYQVPLLVILMQFMLLCMVTFGRFYFTLSIASNIDYSSEDEQMNAIFRILSYECEFLGSFS